MSKRVAIIGAGPAGLTAAYLLGKEKQEVVVFEKDPTYVGGISRTESYKGYHFDIGGHRFFSKSKEVEDFWTEILGDEMLERPRSSRIYYNKSFSYPLVAMEALKKLGIIESALCVLSYLKAKIFPVKNPANFEDWVVNQFGQRLLISSLEPIQKKYGVFLVKKFLQIGLHKELKDFHYVALYGMHYLNQSLLRKGM